MLPAQPHCLSCFSLLAPLQPHCPSLWLPEHVTHTSASGPLNLLFRVPRKLFFPHPRGWSFTSFSSWLIIFKRCLPWPTDRKQRKALHPIPFPPSASFSCMALSTCWHIWFCFFIVCLSLLGALFHLPVSLATRTMPGVWKTFNTYF